MLSRHLKVFLNHTVAAVLARLERTIDPSAHRDVSGPLFKGISIYRVNPTRTTGIATSASRQRRPAAARQPDMRSATRVIATRTAMS